MSILDRVSKAVGDVVDRGKKEVDQFMKIQKINSQISDIEKSINESKSQIQQSKVKIGEMAIEMLGAGALVSVEMKELVDQISGIQQQIASREVEISQKKEEIERIRSENKTPKPADAPVDIQPPPPATNICRQCGATANPGAFCSQCGTRLP
jgi:chromosome segregation ATPase